MRKSIGMLCGRVWLKMCRKNKSKAYWAASLSSSLIQWDGAFRIKSNYTSLRCLRDSSLGTKMSTLTIPNSFSGSLKTGRQDTNTLDCKSQVSASANFQARVRTMIRSLANTISKKDLISAQQVPITSWHC